MAIVYDAIANQMSEQLGFTLMLDKCKASLSMCPFNIFEAMLQMV